MIIDQLLYTSFKMHNRRKSMSICQFQTSIIEHICPVNYLAMALIKND